MKTGYSFKPILANLGFILQIAGVLMIIPLAAGFYYREPLALISFFITSFVFFVAGFLLNAFCFREELNILSSSILMFIVFLLLGLVGSIPYLYVNVFQGGVFTKFSNSFFESISGYTTAGFSLVADMDSWPKSLIIYHGLTQWIGGIGIVFILLAFFYPSASVTVSNVGKMIGIDKIAQGIKKVIMQVLLIYMILAIIFVAALYFLGIEVHKAVSVVFSAISTGGFSPVTNFSSLLIRNINWVLSIAMIAGAVNFFMLDKLLDRKLTRGFKKEFILFVFIILAAFVVFFLVSKLDFSTSFFHVISASTTTGFSTIDVVKLDEPAKLILIFLMFVGGMSVSTAGGIKVLRLMIFFKFIPWSIRRFVFDLKEPLMVEGREMEEKEIFIHLLIPLISIMLIFFSVLIFTLTGLGFMDSLFEVVSAFSTSGLSTNIAASSSGLKWLLAGIMILGRIEILPFLIILIHEAKAAK